MNELIERIFKNFTVEGVEIPVEFLRYTGHNTTYITYMEHMIDTEYYSDDELTNYIDYYDFDIFSKGNYIKVIESMKVLLEQNGFKWKPSMTSADMYEDDTGYFHKTLCFAYIRDTEKNDIILV
jgi:hypothetical protein